MSIKENGVCEYGQATSLPLPCIQVFAAEESNQFNRHWEFSCGKAQTPNGPRLQGPCPATFSLPCPDKAVGLGRCDGDSSATGA